MLTGTSLVNKRSLASLVVGLAVSGVCLWYAFQGVDLAAVGRDMLQVGALWVTASVLATVAGLILRAVRWRLLLTGIKAFPLGSLVSATFIGIMANNVLPARMGEFVRAWVLARREQASSSTVFASIVLERLLDLLAALAILGMCLVFLPKLDQKAAAVVTGTGKVVLLGVVGLGLVIALAVRARPVVLRFAYALGERVQRSWTASLLKILEQFLEGLRGLRGALQTLAVLALSLLIWAASIAAFLVLAEGFGLGLTAVQAALVFVVVLFGVALPSAPGFVGTFHGFCVAGLSMVATPDPSVAAAYATLLHGSQWLVINLLGLWCLAADQRITWPGLVREAHQ